MELNQVSIWMLHLRDVFIVQYLTVAYKAADFPDLLSTISIFKIDKTSAIRDLKYLCTLPVSSKCVFKYLLFQGSIMILSQQQIQISTLFLFCWIIIIWLYQLSNYAICTTLSWFSMQCLLEKYFIKDEDIIYEHGVPQVFILNLLVFN